MTPDSDNLNRDGLFTVFVDDGDKYGFKVINNLRVSLYVSLFYFDVSDLSIASYYQPGTAKNGRVYEPLPAGGSLTIGYGSGEAPPQYYFLRDEQDVDVGFLKLFLTTGYVDFSNIPQASPFDPNRPTSPFRPKKPPLWDTLLVTVVQRRGRREDAM
ncbi:hypothetical protein OF83DRAFT_1159204 [Amylostereum chailletii]|nr:hypothetical protein OF83DRAFT_1159204 [Amylostereum chailletii]